MLQIIIKKRKSLFNFQFKIMIDEFKKNISFIFFKIGIFVKNCDYEIENMQIFVITFLKKLQFRKEL